MIVDVQLHDEFFSRGIPTGRRRFVVWQGRKWTYLFHPPSLVTIQVDNAHYAALKPTPAGDVSPRKLARLIRLNRRVRKKLEMFDGGNNADKALALLKAA